MSEEVRKAKHAVPRALFWTIALNGILAYAIVIVLLITMGSLDNVLKSAFPIVTILQGVTGSDRATTALIIALFVVQSSVTIASVSSTSRLSWAWARDGGLPSWFAYVCVFTSYLQTTIKKVTNCIYIRLVRSATCPKGPSGFASY